MPVLLGVSSRSRHPARPRPLLTEEQRAHLRYIRRDLALLVEFARTNGAATIEGYCLANKGAKIDTTMAYVGTMALFENAGFVKASSTDSVPNGLPRVLLRLDLP